MIITDGKPCGALHDGDKPYKIGIEHIRQQHPAYFDKNLTTANKATYEASESESTSTAAWLPTLTQYGRSGPHTTMLTVSQ